jgi:hypothetical protein
MLSESRQIVPLPHFDFGLKKGDALAFLGSCFATNMALKARDFGFEVGENPNGIIFNPLNLASALKGVLLNTPIVPFEAKNEFISFDHHGSFRTSDRAAFVEKITKERADFKTILDRAKVLFVTFGTAGVFRHLETDTIVANCHRLPTQDFDRRMLTQEEIISHWKEVLQLLREAYPKLQVVFTVSPVRYKNLGAHGNQLSKATLLLAQDKLIQNHPNTHYFPAYEIVLDELRDYRFYTSNLAQVNETAVDYIWERLMGSCLG